MRGLRGAQGGQAATETMLSMLFLMLMIWGLVHMSMFAVSKYVANYAAWTASRTAMVRGWPGTVISTGAPALAALHVMGNWKWASPPRTFRTQYDFRGRNRHVIEVNITVPFGAPIFPSVPAGGIRVYGRAPLAPDHGSMSEWGDQR